MGAVNLCYYEAKWPNLKLKTRPKQLLGSIPLASVLPAAFRRMLMQGTLTVWEGSVQITSWY